MSAYENIISLNMPDILGKIILQTMNLLFRYVCSCLRVMDFTMTLWTIWLNYVFLAYVSLKYPPLTSRRDETRMCDMICIKLISQSTWIALMLVKWKKIGGWKGSGRRGSVALQDWPGQMHTFRPTRQTFIALGFARAFTSSSPPLYSLPCSLYTHWEPALTPA